jgi:hypothetical protein
MNKLIKKIKGKTQVKYQLNSIEDNINFVSEGEYNIKSFNKKNIFSLSIFSLSILLFIFSIIFFSTPNKNNNNNNNIGNLDNTQSISSLCNLYYDVPVTTIEIKGYYLINVYLGFNKNNTNNNFYPQSYVLLFDYIEMSPGSPKINLVFNSSEYVTESNFNIDIKQNSYIVNTFPNESDKKPLEVTLFTGTPYSSSTFYLDLYYYFNALANLEK